MMDEEKASANSEIRFIALELTKLAAQKKKPFREMAEEYVNNVYELDGMLRELSLPPLEQPEAPQAGPDASRLPEQSSPSSEPARAKTGAPKESPEKNKRML